MELIGIDLDAEPVEIIEHRFAGLFSGELGLSAIRGGQTAANLALADLDISGYALTRSEVFPTERRGASRLSPYIRHNMLTLRHVHKAVEGAPYKDREKFRDELYWQEYARHLYARVGVRLFSDLRFEAPGGGGGNGWNREMLCVDEVLTELETDGWLVNQTRMWLASEWAVRNGHEWLRGQETMFQNLLDGSRAANLLGWQWTVGAGTGKPYGFARWQVEKRAPGLCKKCPLVRSCPIAEFPADSNPRPVASEPLLDHDTDLRATSGPTTPEVHTQPDVVLLTIDSLGDADPAMTAHPELPVVFVFNQAALEKLQLNSRRLGFYIETLQDLATRRNVQVFLGDPYLFAQKNKVAVTFAPVPSFRKFHDVAELHPFPWLIQPGSGSLKSFSSWRRSLRF